MLFVVRVINIFDKIITVYNNNCNEETIQYQGSHVFGLTNLLYFSQLRVIVTGRACGKVMFSYSLSVCLCVCLCVPVPVITVECLDIETLFLAWQDIMTTSRSCLVTFDHQNHRVKVTSVKCASELLDTNYCRCDHLMAITVKVKVISSSRLFRDLSPSRQWALD